MKKKCFLGALLAVFVMLLCSGCGVEESITIRKDLSSRILVKYYTTSQEEAAVAEALDGAAYEQLMRETGCTYAGTEELDGVSHNVYQLAQKMSKAETKESFAVLNAHQAVLGVEDVQEMSDEFAGGEEFPENLNFLQKGRVMLKMKYPFPVYRTNGTLQPDGYTVQYTMEDMKAGGRIYAVDSKKIANARKCTISGVKNKGCYRKTKKVKISSEGVITGVAVNGESYPLNEFEASQDGTYKITVKLLSGSVKNLQFIIDKTKPSTNVKAKSYRNKVKISFQDKTSGIKQATLDGKKIKNGTVVSQKGNHLLKITDRAGNVRSVKFSVK